MGFSDSRHEIVGFYDDYKQSETYFNYPNIRKYSNIKADYHSHKFRDNIIIGIGYNHMEAHTRTI